MTYLRKLYGGRLNRKNYILGLISAISSVFVITLVGVIAADSISDIFFLIVFIIDFIIIIFAYFLHVRRLHDIGISGWAVLLLLIPVVNLLILLMLLIKKGQIGANKYGDSKNDGFSDSIFVRS